MTMLGIFSLVKKFISCINHICTRTHYPPYLHNVVNYIRFVTFVNADTPEIRCSVHLVLKSESTGLHVTLQNWAEIAECYLTDPKTSGKMPAQARYIIYPPLTYKSTQSMPEGSKVIILFYVLYNARCSGKNSILITTLIELLQECPMWPLVTLEHNPIYVVRLLPAVQRFLQFLLSLEQ